MAYNVYDKKLKRIGRLPAATIGGGGTIQFNAAACRVLQEHGGFTSVLLLSDLDLRKIAFRAANKSDKRSYRVSYRGQGTQACIHASGFLAELGWDRQKYKTDVRWDEVSSLLEIRMPEWGKGGRPKIVAFGDKQKAG